MKTEREKKLEEIEKVMENKKDTIKEKESN